MAKRTKKKSMTKKKTRRSNPSVDRDPLRKFREEHTQKSDVIDTGEPVPWPVGSVVRYVDSSGYGGGDVVIAHPSYLKVVGISGPAVGIHSGHSYGPVAASSLGSAEKDPKYWESGMAETVKKVLRVAPKVSSVKPAAPLSEEERRRRALQAYQESYPESIRDEDDVDDRFYDTYDENPSDQEIVASLPKTYRRHTLTWTHEPTGWYVAVRGPVVNSKPEGGYAHPYDMADSVKNAIDHAYNDDLSHATAGGHGLEAYVEENPMRLGKQDKAVIRAFTDKREASSKSISTDGNVLDGHWLGGRNIAYWRDEKIHFSDVGSKAAQTVQNAIKREAPKNDLYNGRGYNPGSVYQVPSEDLRVGMVVRAPEYVLDENGHKQSWQAVWRPARAPDRLVVEHWDYEDGTSKLRALTEDGKRAGYVDYNTNDYFPQIWYVEGDHESNPSGGNPFEKIATDSKHPTDARLLAIAFVSAHNSDEVYPIARAFDRERRVRGGQLGSWLDGTHFTRWHSGHQGWQGDGFEEIQEYAHKYLERHRNPSRRRSRKRNPTIGYFSEVTLREGVILDESNEDLLLLAQLAVAEADELARNPVTQADVDRFHDEYERAAKKADRAIESGKGAVDEVNAEVDKAWRAYEAARQAYQENNPSRRKNPAPVRQKNPSPRTASMSRRITGV